LFTNGQSIDCKYCAARSYCEEQKQSELNITRASISRATKRTVVILMGDARHDFDSHWHALLRLQLGIRPPAAQVNTVTERTAYAFFCRPPALAAYNLFGCSSAAVLEFDFDEEVEVSGEAAETKLPAPSIHPTSCEQRLFRRARGRAARKA
jgi:hypothetical protein